MKLINLCRYLNFEKIWKDSRLSVTKMVNIIWGKKSFMFLSWSLLHFIFFRCLLHSCHSHHRVSSCISHMLSQSYFFTLIYLVLLPEQIVVQWFSCLNLKSHQKTIFTHVIIYKVFVKWRILGKTCCQFFAKFCTIY